VWHLVTVAPNAERRVSYGLALFDFPHHVFRLSLQVVVRGQLRERLRPAFPGYGFVRVGDRWSELKQVGGVTGFVRGTGGDIAFVSDAVVMDLLACCSSDHPDDEVFVTSPRASTRFRTGDRVRIANWSYDTVATFERMVGLDKALVTLEWFGRSVSAQVDEADLSLDSEANQVDYLRPRRQRPRGRRRRLPKHLRHQGRSSPVALDVPR